MNDDDAMDDDDACSLNHQHALTFSPPFLQELRCALQCQASMRSPSLSQNAADASDAAGNEPRILCAGLTLAPSIQPRLQSRVRPGPHLTCVRRRPRLLLQPHAVLPSLPTMPTTRRHH